MITTRYNLRKHYLKYHTGEGPALRIALVSDLHDRCPDPVLSALRREKTDLICIPGDLGERHEVGAVMANGEISPWTVDRMNELQGKKKLQSRMTKVIKFLDGSLSEEEPCFLLKRRGNCVWDRSNGYRFLREASQIAPIIYSTGNHEWYLTAPDMEVIKACRVELVDNRDICLFIKGREVRIGGLPTRIDPEWLQAYADSESGNAVKILLMHHPEYYDRYLTGLDTFDLILSGHAHGGQWRIRGRGIFAPNQGFLPKYHHGVYRTQNPGGALVVSAGCSNTTNIPRFGNPTELVMVKI